MAEGLIIAAPSSGSGKTVVTLAILRALKRLGVNVASAKAGPDYIDPRFHEAATAKPCLNLDPWAMRSALVKSLLAKQARDAELVIVEGVMGLFDGAENAQGSTADLAAATGLPVVLVVDASRQAQSVAALVHGFKTWRQDINLAAIILNRVGSPRHAEVLKASLKGIHVIGALPRLDHLELPSRHLGLVQADELETLETFLEQAADAPVAAALQPMVARLAALIGSSREDLMAPQGLSVWARAQRTLQPVEAYNTFKDWLDERNPRFAFSVARALVMGSMVPESERGWANLMRQEARGRMAWLLPPGTILCLPTTPFPAPLRGQRLSMLDPLRDRITCLCAQGGLAGHPQVNLPGTTVDGLPVGLSIIGPRGSDATLVAVAQALEAQA